MTERVKILEYQNNTDGTVTVLICGKEAGTFQTREVAILLIEVSPKELVT